MQRTPQLTPALRPPPCSDTSVCFSSQCKCCRVFKPLPASPAPAAPPPPEFEPGPAGESGRVPLTRPSPPCQGSRFPPPRSRGVRGASAPPFPFLPPAGRRLRRRRRGGVQAARAPDGLASWWPPPAPLKMRSPGWGLWLIPDLPGILGCVWPQQLALVSEVTLFRGRSPAALGRGAGPPRGLQGR